jgi:hypothetical protein
MRKKTAIGITLIFADDENFRRMVKISRINIRRRKQRAKLGLLTSQKEKGSPNQ